MESLCFGGIQIKSKYINIFIHTTVILLEIYCICAFSTALRNKNDLILKATPEVQLVTPGHFMLAVTDLSFLLQRSAAGRG